MSRNDPVVHELDAHERRLFASLPRELASASGAADSVVHALRGEGFFRPPSQRTAVVRFLTAAVLLAGVALGGGVVGARVVMRTSLEGMIARDDLSVADRVLLLQRAGSAYVQAAHAYADATAAADSTAVEVAQQVLRGAAHAVVRSELDAGVAARLTSALQTPGVRPASATSAPVLWF